MTTTITDGGVLPRIVAAASARAERVERWVRKRLRRLARHALGALAKAFAQQLARKADPHQPGRHAGRRTAGGEPPPQVLPPQQVDRLLASMSTKQIAHVAHGLSPAEVEAVSAQLPTAQARKAPAALDQLEHAARELVDSGG
jgi:hypothetical protein